MKTAAVALAVLASLTPIMAQMPEQLFLDLPVEEVQNGTTMGTVEPWASLYCQAVTKHRYSDAIYARYNLDGRSSNGMFMDTNHTVVEEIQTDAIGYHAGYSELYAEALLIYSNNSNEDTRPEIIEYIRNVPSQNGTVGTTR